MFKAMTRKSIEGKRHQNVYLNTSQQHLHLEKEKMFIHKTIMNHGIPIRLPVQQLNVDPLSYALRCRRKTRI